MVIYYLASGPSRSPDPDLHASAWAPRALPGYIGTALGALPTAHVTVLGLVEPSPLVLRLRLVTSQGPPYPSRSPCLLVSYRPLAD